jgi:hypothetical protein
LLVIANELLTVVNHHHHHHHFLLGKNLLLEFYVGGLFVGYLKFSTIPIFSYSTAI